MAISGSEQEPGAAGTVTLAAADLKITDPRDYEWTFQVKNLDGGTAAVSVLGPAGEYALWTDVASPLDVDNNSVVIAVGRWSGFKVVFAGTAGNAVVGWEGVEKTLA